MWFIFITARLFIFLSFQPRLAATLLRLCSVVNNPTRRVGLSPTFRPTSLVQTPFPPVQLHGHGLGGMAIVISFFLGKYFSNLHKRYGREAPFGGEKRPLTNSGEMRATTEANTPPTMEARMAAPRTKQK